MSCGVYIKEKPWNPSEEELLHTNLFSEEA